MALSGQTLSGKTRTYALIGHPVAHSRSPALHAALFSAHEIDAVYLCFEVPPSRSGGIVSAVRTLGLAGANLTVPHKESVVGQLDRLTPAAERAGSVNVLAWEGDALIGDNTDGAGLVDSVRESGGTTSEAAIVLGAGGTARAVAAALLDAGAPRVTLLNRTLARAQTVATAVGAEAGPLTSAGFRDAARAARLVVNCTAGPAASAVRALDIRGLADGAVWIDANYWMPDPPHNAAPGVRFVSGHGMLLHQGVRAWQRWTGRAPSPAAIEAARDRVGP
jgi:shikimate dehydrogenase